MSLANDKISLHTRYIAGNALVASTMIRSGFSNVITVDALNFQSGNRANRSVFVGETGPGTDYDSYAKIGDEYLQITFSSGVPATVKKYLYLASGIWGEQLNVPQSTDLVRTSATKEINVQSANSGTGDHRAFYGKISLTHASGGSGEAVRGYAIANGGVNACRGAHLTGEVGTVGSVVGILSGATIQATTASGLTLSGGTLAALELTSDLSSAVSGMTASSFIRLSENQTNKLPALIQIDSSVTGCVGATTASTAAGTLIVNHAGTTKYIQMYSAAS